MGGFEYFHGTTAEQFQFYMIPQLLFTDDRFKKISCDAKVLYSLLLDRTGLSFRNPDKFVDENNRTFIYFTRDTVMEMLNCGKEKSASMFQELEKIGLIERKVQGLGKPTKIYVKDFSKPIENTQKGNNLQEVGKTDLLKSEKPTSVSRESRPLKVGKTDPNHTNNNHTNNNHTDINQTNQTAAEAADRTTDIKSFKDILTEIGYQFQNIPREDFAKGEMTYTTDISSSQQSRNFTKLDNLFNSLATRLATVQNDLERAEANLENGKQQLDKPFEYESDLQIKEARLIALINELEESPAPIVEEEQSVSEQEQTEETAPTEITSDSEIQGDSSEHRNTNEQAVNTDNKTETADINADSDNTIIQTNTEEAAKPEKKQEQSEEKKDEIRQNATPDVKSEEKKKSRFCLKDLHSERYAPRSHKNGQQKNEQISK